MTIRYPMPWEHGASPMRVEPVLGPLRQHGADAMIARFPELRNLDRLFAAGDSGAAPRGCAGAAARLYSEYQARGIETTRLRCRERVESARSTCENRRDRRGYERN